MKILIVSNYQWPHLGGSEVICDQFRQSWTRLGHSVTWFTTDLPRGGAASTARNVRVPAWNYFEERWQINCPIVNPFVFGRMIRTMKEHDAVFVQSLAPGLTSLAIAAALFLKKPLVVNQQIGVIPLKWRALNYLQEKFMPWVASVCIKRGAWVIFPIRRLLDHFQKTTQLSSERFTVIPNAHDKNDFSYADPEERYCSAQNLKLSSGRFKVLFVGRFVDKKGIHYIEELARSCPEIDFTLVGQGVHFPETWGLDNVRVVAPVSEKMLRAYFVSHDLLLLPSVGEGWPLVICESMACGTPCLISRETFNHFQQDEEMFLVSELNHRSLQTILKKCSNGEVALLSQHKELSDYACMTWDWNRSASMTLSLFQKCMDNG